jgi:carbamoyltransferase
VDLAWAAQELLERAALVLARRLVEEQGVDALCLAGGVALNCKMNGEILRRSGARRLFVQPAAHDGGAALGAALQVSQRLGAAIRQPLLHTQYGPAFDAAAIRAALDAARVPWRRVDDPALETARLLEEGRIVGWFQGGMEFGARALGGRSILADPARPEMRDRVNAEVKQREAWRPFCPSLLQGSEAEYLKEPGDAAFMIVACEASEGCRAALASVVHVDGSVRPQVVREDAAPRFYALLRELGRRTGHPVALNTSFNVRGEPLVCTPQDALRCFYSTGLEALCIGEFLLVK